MSFKRFEKFLVKNNIEFKKNEEMKNHTSIRIGGRVKIFLEARSIKDLIKIKNEANKQKLKLFVLGNGTNLVFSDKLTKMVVLKLNLKKMIKKDNTLIVGSGVGLFEANIFAVKNSLSGLEWSYGIPGSVGGALFMNAGSFGGEMKDVVLSAKVLDENNEIKTLSNAEMEFEYRKSIFQKNKYIILEVVLNLFYGEEKEIFRKCLENLEKRKQNQPYDKFSAGSVFKKVNNIPAWKIIESVGFRGYKVGGAMISRKHCGFIVNVQSAKFYDVLKIIYEIKKTVYKKFAIILEEEIQFVGDINGHFRRLSHTYDLQQKKMVSKKACKRNT